MPDSFYHRIRADRPFLMQFPLFNTISSLFCKFEIGNPIFIRRESQ